MGMAQVAGKFKGIRAACVESVYAARMCRAINDANLLCLGGWLIGREMGLEMSRVFWKPNSPRDWKNGESSTWKRPNSNLPPWKRRSTVRKCGPWAPLLEKVDFPTAVGYNQK